MKKNGLLLILGILFFTLHSFSQVPAPVKVKGTVKGTIVDTSGKQNLSAATVSVMPGTDTSLTEFVVTDKKGAFLIRGLATGEYHLEISFEGYQTINKTFTITADAKDVDMATLYMQRASQEMEAVVVSRPPINMKKDTVEYTAGMFAVKPNAVAEDLLKKLPGVQVDKSGNITAQGETVTRILVNGKRFFSDDPKLATRNLPPDIIDKIQVFDDLSDQSKFTGFDDGNRVKTINITTKKANRMGYFGKAVAGVGTDGNYDESINMHRFDNDRQVSLLGQANDVNKQNFTPQDILGNAGGRQRGGGGGGGGGGFGGGAGQSSSGITTIWAGGANYRDAWSPNTDAYGSYFYNQQHVTTQQNSHTQSNVGGKANPDSTNLIDQSSLNFQRTENHRINFNIEHRFDSSNSLIFRPGVTFQTSTPNGSSSTITTTGDGALVNSLIGHNSSYNTGFNINNANLQFRHKFKKPFRTVSLDLNTTANTNNGYGYTYSINTFTGIRSGIDTINQRYNDSLHTLNFSPTLSYTEPIAKNQILELNYNYTYNRNTSINNTYDFEEASHGFTRFDSLFSNSYKFTSNSNRVSLNYRIQNEKFNLGIGSGLQFTDFNSLNTTKNILVAHNYVNFTPTANFIYTITRTEHLRFNYTGRTGTPTASQLQPLTTTSDSVNFTVGNPNLKPQFTHSMRILYTSFDPGTQRLIFATINASAIMNDIQSSIVRGDAGRRTSTYVNLNGTYNISGYFNYGFALKKPKSNLNFITNVNYTQSQNLQKNLGDADFAHNYTRNTTLSETISWTTNIKKNFDMNFSSASTYNIARNSLQPSQNLNYYSQVLGAEITAYTNSGWLIATTFDYTFNGNRAAGYNASVPLLSPSIAKQLFKKKNGELRLSVFDLLNQNTSVNRAIGDNQITDTRTNTLKRYAMLTFTYNLNNFAGSQQRKMPGVFPGRFRGGGGGGGRRGGGGPDF
ncbi:MAG TPA: TonB-dependent receptor [Puia sp.]|nr:TonB-dependent receptor [Puia sp.]